jgi:hypothetical protein
MTFEQASNLSRVLVGDEAEIQQCSGARRDRGVAAWTLWASGKVGHG